MAVNDDQARQQPSGGTSTARTVTPTPPSEPAMARPRTLAQALGRTAATRLAALGLLVAGYLIAWGINAWIYDAERQPFKIATNLSAFAALFVLALAVERLVEPFSRGLGPDSEKSKEELTEKELVAEAKPGDQAAAKEVAETQAELNDARKKTAVVTWGLASGLGFILAAALNITLLAVIAAEGSGQPPYWVDLLVTGMVIGAGTKPLNDLVTQLEKKSK